MHYNYFTINYIYSIKKHLKININSLGQVEFFPDEILNEDIESLKEELDNLWSLSPGAVEILTTKKDATIQSGLFGLINELETAVRIGFLLGDRVVLIDYLYDRLLKRSKSENINRELLGSLAVGLVNLIPLAETGRIVIIPNPFSWHDDSRKIIKALSEITLMTPELMSMTNMVSIAGHCNLHPFTIAESEQQFEMIKKYNKNAISEVVDKEVADYTYQGIMAALLSEKLLQETELKIALRVPLSKYFNIIASNADFYGRYLSAINSGGILNSHYNINLIRDDVMKSIELREKNSNKNVLKAVSKFSAVGGGSLALLGLISVISAPLAIAGGALALIGNLGEFVPIKETNENCVISVFRNLYTDPQKIK